MIAVYIDVQNTYMRAKDCNREIDREKFFVYIKDSTKADYIYYVVGHIASLQKQYDTISCYGYTMIYKKTGKQLGEIKGNVDVDIVIQSMYDLFRNNLTKAYLVSNDGDFNTLIEVWKNEGIFGGLYLPQASKASRFMKRLAKDFVDLQRLKHHIKQ